MKNIAKPSVVANDSPVMSLAEAMRTMGEVMLGHAPIPKNFPKSTTYFDSESAKKWKNAGMKSDVASKPQAPALPKGGRQAAPGLARRKSMTTVIADASQFAAFAKLYVDNGQLLSILASEGAESIAGLAHRLSKDPGNLARTLKKFEAYGIVRMEPVGNRVKRPVLATEEVDLKVNFKSGHIKLAA